MVPFRLNPFVIFFFLLASAIHLVFHPISNADTAYIPVGAGKVKKVVIAFPEVRSNDEMSSSLAKTLSETVENDLLFMDLFKFLGKAAFVEDSSTSGIAPDTFKFSDWTGIGTEFLIKSSLSYNAQQVVFQAYLYDTFGAKQVLAKRYTASAGNIKATAHTFANDVVQAMTGLPGIFQTKIAMACEMGGKKEIYMMNFDGSEVKQVTHHRSLAFAPAWSHDGTRIAYSLYTRHANNIRNIDLYEFNFSTNTVRMLSNKKGINSGAAYSPDGRKLAMTMSFGGNPDIYILDLDTKATSRLTNSLGFDVDPSWSPDGKSMAFVSSRSGNPMIFSLKADGSSVQRLTYAGKYNATPSWSPQHGKIAFAGWIDRAFDIFIMNPDGSNIERLTKDQSNNEDPFFSPDGNFIVFSSNRTGQKNIYVMNVDGTFVKRLTYGLGNCVSPKWSNPSAPPVPKS
jgi:TolB protein